jgi:hypothetical protein
MEAFNIDKCDYLKNRLHVLAARRGNFRFDTLSYGDLLLAPFKPKNILTPITGLFVAAGIAELLLFNGDKRHSIRDVRSFSYFDGTIDRGKGLWYYGAVSLGASYGAGIGEEYCFRNTLLPVWDYAYGQQKGLIYSSLFFGSLHFANILFSNNPDYLGTIAQVVEATAAGYALGADVQHRNYSIGPAVAAHTWYDFTLMLGSFLIDPKDNAFGVSVNFKVP